MIQKDPLGTKQNHMTIQSFKRNGMKPDKTMTDEETFLPVRKKLKTDGKRWSPG